jgi:hypothetical protein
MSRRRLVESCGLPPNLCLSRLSIKEEKDSRQGGIRTPDQRIRSAWLYPAELLARKLGRRRTAFPSQLSYYTAFWSDRQPSSTTSVSDTSGFASSVTSGSGSFTPTASRYSIAP